MGHSNSKNNGKDSAPEYIPDFEVMRMVESHNYGRVKLVRDIKTGGHMILREVLFDTKQAFENEVKSFEEKEAFEHQNIIQIIGYYTTEANNFCSRFFKVAVFIENPHKNLESDIKEHAKTSLKYNDEEILMAADNIVSALSHLQQTKDLSHGDIRPANIYVSGQTYKITDPKLEVDQNANILVKAIINNSKVYLSPELLKNVPARKFELTEDKHKADIFALGVTLLNMATLKDSEELYNYETGEFHEGILHHRLHHVKRYYSPFTYDLIRAMLEIDEHHRPSLDDVRERLAGFSREHHCHHNEEKSKGWEQGRFRFVGEVTDDTKLVSWKYKHEVRLAYEQSSREERCKKEDQEKEHAVKAVATLHIHEANQHLHKYKTFEEITPIQPHKHLTISSQVTPFATEQNSVTPTHNHHQIQLDSPCLSARTIKNEEKEYSLKAFAAPQVQEGYLNMSSNATPRAIPTISASPTNNYHMHRDNIVSPTKINTESNYFGVAEIYNTANIHQPVRSPGGTSYYQGNFGGATSRASYKVKPLNSFEENIASYNYTLGGSPLKPRSTRSTNFGVIPDALNHSYEINQSPQGQDHKVFEELKQFNLAQSQVYSPVHQNFQVAPQNRIAK